ncbi:MAG: pyridoxine 5'-phosphate synthase [Deltaproteobacteria bacterium]|nr:pyridoxine 5'-phosphate synthase [Deltaproteobacteria bacterium]MBW2394728.1 pyridoxine 5'-phosphate synthase [Deltaproteobacteria bacterium]
MRKLITGLDAIAVLRDQVLQRTATLGAASILAELGGADAVRVGLLEELRPVTESDVLDIRRAARQLELRMAPMPTLVKSALEARPERVLLAAETRSAGRSAGPLDFQAWGSALSPVVRTLQEAGIGVMARIAAHPEAVKAARHADIPAVELDTHQIVDLPETELEPALDALSDAARLAAKLGLRVGLGGRLDERSAPRLLEVAPVCEWVAVGREWVGRSLLSGIDQATRDLRGRIS